MMLGMRNNINRLLWCVVLACLLLCGCAADKAYDEGVRLLERGNYDSAVAKLKKSVRLDEKDKFVNDLDGPCCGVYSKSGDVTSKSVEEKNEWPWEDKKKLSKYRLKLKEAKRRGAKYHYRQGKSDMARTDLGAAKVHILKALKYDQSVFEYHDLLKIITASTAKAEDMRKEALEFAKLKNWPDAVRTMEQALAAYKSMPHGKQTLDKIKRDAYDYHYQLAYDFLAKDDRDDAAAQAREALVYVPKGQAAKNILTKIANRNKADGLVVAAEKLMATGQSEQALETLQYAYKLYPSMPNIMILVKNAKMAVCDKIIASGNKYLQTGRFEQALRCFRRSRRMLNGYKNVGLLIEKASYALADGHSKKAASFSQRQLFANAILQDVLSIGYRAENDAVKERLLNNKKRIQKDIKYVMGFLGFDSSPKNRDLANTLEAVAVQHLTRVKPPNVLFMERMNLDKVMDELNFNITDMVDPEFRIERGKLKGVDALIGGKILENKVLSSSTTSHGNTKYQSGTKMVTNPKYPPAQLAYEKAVYNLGRARRKLAELRRRHRHIKPDTEGDNHRVAEHIALDAAISRAQKEVNHSESRADIAHNYLNMTPQQVSVARILPWKYPIQRVTKTAKVGLFIKVLDTMTGSIIFSDRVVGKYTQSDDFVKGDSVRNVVADPLDLPSESAMLDKAMDKLIVNMNNSLELASKKHGQRFVANMRIAEKIGDSEKAVENCIRYLFAYPVGSDHTNKMISYLESLISAEKDLVDLNGLLQRHCHVLLRQAEFPANLKNSNDRVIITRLNTRVAERIKLPCTLIAIDGRPISSIKEVDAIMTQYGVGDRISITVMSNNRNVSTEIELSKVRR